jgi:type IV pilus assembly protein PilV
MQLNHAPSPQRAHRRQRGLGLLDGIIGLVIFSFGLLAMTRYQARMVASTTEAQGRLAAVLMSDELISNVLVDSGNAACYTLPQAGTCASSAALSRTTDWHTRTTAALPGAVTTSSVLAANGRLTVVIGWTGKESNTARRLEATTDVR